MNGWPSLAGLASLVLALNVALAQPVATSRPDLPANTWLEAKPAFVLPANLPDATWVTTDGYSGSFYRSKTGTIVWRTGVASKQAGLSPGFYSNAFLEWDLRANEAAVIDVGNWGGGSYGGGKLLAAFKDRPTPTPRHTYDCTAYVEEEDAVYVMLGANWRIAATRADAEAKAQFDLDNKSTWKYTFADGRWHRIDSSIRDFWGGEVSPYEAHMRYWPEGGKFIFIDDKGTHYAEFDLRDKAQKWVKAELKNKPTVPLYNARSTWDSKRQLWVFRLGPRLGALNPKTREFQTIPDAYEMPVDEKDPRRASKGICYIPKHDVYLIAGPAGNDTYVFDIGKTQWRNIRGGDLPLVNGYTQYDPSTDLVGLAYQKNACWFRYVPEAKEK